MGRRSLTWQFHCQRAAVYYTALLLVLAALAQAIFSTINSRTRNNDCEPGMDEMLRRGTGGVPLPFS